VRRDPAALAYAIVTRRQPFHPDIAAGMLRAGDRQIAAAVAA
jgi:hypothetical protein